MKVDALLSRTISFVSFVSALCVVLGHTSTCIEVSGLWGRVYRECFVHGILDYPVSYFFLISGYMFVKDWEPRLIWYKTSVTKRMRTLLLPYLIWNLLGVVCFGSWHFRLLFQELGLTSLLPIVTPLWFVKMLMVFCLISPFLIMLVNIVMEAKRRLGVALLLFGVVCLAPMPLKCNVVMSCCYFMIGLWLGLSKSVLIVSRTVVKFAGLGLFVCLVAKGIGVVIPYSYSSQIRFFMVPCVIVVILHVANRIVLSDMIPHRLYKYFSFSFVMYVAHYFALVPIIERAPFLIGSPVRAILTTAVIVIAILLVAKCLLVVSSPFYAVLVGGRVGERRSA